MDKESLMKEDEDNATTFDEKITKQYNEAVKKGFSGTKTEYIAVRDYT